MSDKKKKDMAEKMGEQAHSHHTHKVAGCSKCSNMSGAKGSKPGPDNESQGRGDKTNALPAGGEKAR